MRTVAMETYLETIYDLEQKDGVARVKDIAKELDVSTPSVSSMLDRLVEKELAEHEKYGYVKLTPKGRQTGKRLESRHLAIKTFFRDVLGVDAETADQDACKIEHVISKESAERLVEFINKNRGST